MVPVIYSAHHASYDFGTFADRCALLPEERKRYCDLGTEQTVPRNGIQTFIGEYSRGLIDLNRAPDAPTLFPEYDFARPKPHPIWREGEGLSEEERA